MPAAQRDWIRAMRAEAAYFDPGPVRTRFALGCLWAALGERVLQQAVLVLGIAGGLACAAHATIPGSGPWPLAWPLVGGVLVIAFSARQGRSVSVASGAWQGCLAGALGGLLFAAAGAIFIVAQGAVPLGARVEVLVLGAAGTMIFSTFGAALAAPMHRWLSKLH